MRKRIAPKTTYPTEHIEQTRVVNWLEQRDIVFFAVPNANILLNMLPKHRQFSVQKHMVAEGMRAGVPDIIILSKPNKKHDSENATLMPIMFKGEPVKLDLNDFNVEQKLWKAKVDLELDYSTARQSDHVFTPTPNIPKGIIAKLDFEQAYPNSKQLYFHGKPIEAISEYNGIALEMKKIMAKNHKLPCNCMSDEQKYWKTKVESCNWLHILAHGSEDAIEQLERLGF